MYDHIYIFCSYTWSSWGCPSGVMVKAMDCGIFIFVFFFLGGDTVQSNRNHFFQTHQLPQLEWTWEYWPWRDTQDTPNLQKWSLFIRCSFVSYSRHHFCGFFNPLCRMYSERILSPTNRLGIFFFFSSNDD